MPPRSEPRRCFPESRVRRRVGAVFQGARRRRAPSLWGGPAISITADSLAVGLRNLVIAPLAGSNSGTLGVEMTGDSQLVIEGCAVRAAGA